MKAHLEYTLADGSERSSQLPYMGDTRGAIKWTAERFLEHVRAPWTTWRYVLDDGTVFAKGISRAEIERQYGADVFVAGVRVT